MNILVIDDDPAVCYVIAKILRSADYDVVTAGDGLIGLDTFRKGRFGLVITDIIMPAQEGIETIRILREEYPDAQIIAISGGARLGNIDFLSIARKLGADDIIHKPFDAEELLSRVRRFSRKAAA